MRLFLALGFFIAFFPLTAMAVPPPDFLFQAGAQIAQIFAVVAVFLTAVFGTLWQYAKVYVEGFKRLRHRPLLLAAIFVSILLVSWAIAWGYQQYQQQQSTQQWERQSESYRASMEPETADVSPSLPESLSPSPPQELATHVPPAPNTLALKVSNEEFQKIITENTSVFVLDGREDEEYGIGHFPGSKHIRYADILDGAWKQLPKDQIMYVFCWSGIRGKELAEFLRSHDLNARFLENGADGWFKAGGKWEGQIAFSSQYSAERYRRLFTKEEVQQYLQNGTILVDTRPPSRYQRHHISGSLNIPLIYTSSDRLEAALSAVPSGASVITVCDDFVSCFDAKVTAIKLEARGHEFLGRYNKPWEF